MDNSVVPDTGLYWAAERQANGEYRKQLCIVEISGAQPFLRATRIYPQDKSRGDASDFRLLDRIAVPATA